MKGYKLIKKYCMSPKVHYPLEQTVLSDNLVIYTGEPDLSDFKSSLVAADQQESPTGGRSQLIRNGAGRDWPTPFPNHIIL